MLRIIQMFTKPKDTLLVKSTLKCGRERYSSTCEYVQEVYSNIVGIPIVPNYYSVEERINGVVYERINSVIYKSSEPTMYFFATNIRPRWFK